MNEPLLRATGLRAGYAKTEIVHGIDLEVNAGEIVALFGPNGAGKTTTLLTLVGVLPRQGGEVAWEGSSEPLAAHQNARRGRILVAEKSVFSQLTTIANLRLGRGDPDHALDLFPELVPLLNRRAGLLSGGEQQMLAMGRALAGRPAALLLDEMCAGLAPVVVNRLLESARAAAANGVAVLMVEQQVRRALKVADRGYVLTRGQLSFAGDRAALQTHFAADGGSYFESSGHQGRP